jgi:TonB family C-terminal domain
MSKELKRIQNFDDIVFEVRNKEYGAFVLRKKYSRNVIISLLSGIVIMATAIITPYFNAKAMENRQEHVERHVEIVIQNLDQPNEMVVPPPPPPPPNIIQQVKYVPPIVVDSVKLEDTVRLMTVDEVQTKVKNKDVLEIVKEAKEEVQEGEAEHVPFLSVQEMPEPVGGESVLYKYIADNTHYPVIAKENGIEGKVFVRFCVTSKGAVDQVSILKGVDPDLDAEAIKVVKTFPLFKPGKQDGKPVPVWFSVSINFQIQ